MPIERIDVQKDRAWGIWRMQESEEELQRIFKTPEIIPAEIAHPQKRLEYLTGRVLAKQLCEALGKPFNGITKDSFGKPYFKESTLHLSLSHSYPLVSAVADAQQAVGVDIEQVKPKLLRIAPRVLHATELADAGNDLVKHCILWCAKETMIKIHGKKDLVLSEELLITPFKREQYGTLSGKIIANGKEMPVALWYEVMDDYVVVFNT